MTTWQEGQTVRVVEKQISKWAGRIVSIQPAIDGCKPYAWVERRHPDGTIERETYWLHELRPATPTDTSSETTGRSNG